MVFCIVMSLPSLTKDIADAFNSLDTRLGPRATHYHPTGGGNVENARSAHAMFRVTQDSLNRVRKDRLRFHLPMLWLQHARLKGRSCHIAEGILSGSQSLTPVITRFAVQIDTS